MRMLPSIPVADEMVQFVFGRALTLYSTAKQKLLLLLLLDLQPHLLNVHVIFCIVLQKKKC